MREEIVTKERLARRDDMPRRLLAGVAAFFFLAAIALFTGHHHADESDAAPCLICHAASAPAVPAAGLALGGVVDVAAPIPLPSDDHRIEPAWPGAMTARAPPFC
jgi:hypothetical protein